MNKVFVSLLCIFLTCKCYPQRNILFDKGWKFFKGDIANAQLVNFDDMKWRSIDLPHDWSIEDLPGTNSPFNPGVINGVSVGFTTGGTGWYRKTFILDPSENNQRIYLLFDGVYMNADVWLNGEHLGNHPYGYTSFYYNISDKIKKNEKNVIAVQVKNSGATSRWYSGSGIYRHVWLKSFNSIHLAPWGTYITTPVVNKVLARINIKSVITNETKKDVIITVICKILSEKGNLLSKAISKNVIGQNSKYEFNDSCTISSPVLWSPAVPYLYTVRTEVYSNGKLLDHSEVKSGIRKIAFSAVNGFSLNDSSMKLKGACFHNDNGPLGSKSFDRAEIRRVALLKASGFNAIRCSHNPPPASFLDACDSLGMLVIDEAFDMWNEPKNMEDYHLYFKDWWQKDLESMMLRDRNHPSIIMWSIGNEIPNMDKKEISETARMLSDFVHKTDPTRPVTAAVNSVTEKKDAFFSALDICGYNYARDNYETDHIRKPERIMFATESYALTAFDYWMSVLDHPWVIGDFVWTGFDYIGEASIGWLGYEQERTFYPWNLAYCGDIDICGWKRPQSFYRDALWKNDQLSIFVKPLHPSSPLNPKKQLWSIWNWDDVLADWNWKGAEDSVFEVNVYSSCEMVELFLNNKSLGKKQTDRYSKYMGVWHVPYQPGILKAVGYNGSKKIRTSILQTADDPKKMALIADRKIIHADGEDLSYITVELQDSMGIKNPKAENLIKFSIEGPGTIVGIGNANPVSLESYQQSERKAWQGRCLVVVKSANRPGKITLKAKAQGFKSNEVVISSR